MWVKARPELLVEGAKVRSTTNNIEGVMIGWLKRTALVDFGKEHGALWSYSPSKLEWNFLEVWVEEESL